MANALLITFTPRQWDNLSKVAEGQNTTPEKFAKYWVTVGIAQATYSIGARVQPKTGGFSN